VGAACAMMMASQMAADAWRHLAEEVDPRIVDFLIPYFIFVWTYWTVGGLFLLLELSPWASAAMKGIKCQPGKVMPTKSIAKIVKKVAVQQLTVYPAALWVLSPIIRQRCSFSPELPTMLETATGLVVCALCAEVYFFHVHWGLHHPRIYPHVHKVHHEFTAPIALECIYFHPVEAVLNFGVVGSGPLLLGSHVTVLYLFTFIAMVNILVHHCGYEVPLDSVPKFGSMAHQHDYHHKVFNRNFGVIGICDWLYGTSEGYAEYHARWEQKQSIAERSS